MHHSVGWSDRHRKYEELAAAARISIVKVLAVAPSIERTFQHYVQARQIQSLERAKAAAIRDLHEDAIAVASGAPRSRRFSLADAVAMMGADFHEYFSRGESFYSPLPTPEELRNEVTSRQAAAVLRDRLQYGVAPPKWSQELNQLKLAAQSAENAIRVAQREVPDSATDEIRERRQNNARRRLPQAQRDVADKFKSLSKPAVKRFRLLAQDASVSLPKIEGVKASRAVIRDILKIFECQRNVIRSNSERVPRNLQHLLHACDFPSGRPSNELAHEFVLELAIIWRQMTGKHPSRTASHHHRGPFVRFVAIAFRIAGTPHVDPVEAVNAYGRKYRVADKEQLEFYSPRIN